MDNEIEQTEQKEPEQAEKAVETPEEKPEEKEPEDPWAYLTNGQKQELLDVAREQAGRDKQAEAGTIWDDPDKYVEDKVRAALQSQSEFLSPVVVKSAMDTILDGLNPAEQASMRSLLGKHPGFKDATVLLGLSRDPVMLEVFRTAAKAKAPQYKSPPPTDGGSATNEERVSKDEQEALDAAKAAGLGWDIKKVREVLKEERVG